MRDLKHTQGEWIKAKVNRFNIVDEGGNIIASANCNYLIEDVEAEANAKLIAAAPFMLQMLKEIAEGVGNGCHRNDIHSRAIEGIKKATE